MIQCKNTMLIYFSYLYRLQCVVVTPYPEYSFSSFVLIALLSYFINNVQHRGN